MRKFNIFILGALMLTAGGLLNAQTGELIKGGAFKTSDVASWTIGVNKNGDVADVAFGNVDGLPTGAKATTSVKFTQGGNGAPEIQMYQRVKLKGNVTYKVSAKLKTTVYYEGAVVQLYVAKDSVPDNGTCFSDAIMNTGERSKSAALFLEGWPFNMSGTDPVAIDGDFPLSSEGPGSELITPDVDGDYLILFKVGQWGGDATPWSAVITDLSIRDNSTLGIRNQENNLKIYSTGENIKIKGASNKANVEVYDILGRSIIKLKNFSDENINISTLKNGIYIVSVNDGELKYNQKIVKQ